jgi:hypothetical protein
MKKYIERNGQTYSVKLRYMLGGWGYLSHEYSERGYYLFIQPVDATFNEDGSLLCESYKIFEGYKLLLKGVSRQSKKAEQEAIELHEQYVEKMLDELEKERQSKIKVV